MVDELHGFIAMVIVLGTLASVGCSREVPGRQAKKPTFEAEGMNHGALAAEAPDGSADNGSALRWDSGGPASQSVNLSSPANHIVVRSRNAVASTGVVEITVLVDGVPQGTKQIGENETGYRNRSWSVDVPQGEYTISLYGGDVGGDDRLFADWVQIDGSDFTGTTPPTTCEGTEVRPTPNLEAIIDVPDSSWCLRGGTYEEADELINIASANVTIRNFPGERVFINSQLKLLNTSSDFKAIGSDVSPNVEGIVFNPTYGNVSVSSHCSPLKSNPTGPTYCTFTTQENHIYGDNFLFSNIEADGHNDVLYPIWFPQNQQPAVPDRVQSVCFLVTDGGDNEPASDGVFEYSDIHNCGALPIQGLVDPDPGDHALYLSEGLRTVIRHNLIRDNGARGVQLRNQTIKPLVEGNVIHNNGRGVTLDDDVTKAVVRGNVITENPKANVDTAPMYSGSNNRVVDNCVWQADGDSGLGTIDPSVLVSGNVTTDPRYDPFPTVTNANCLDKYTDTLAR